MIVKYITLGIHKGKLPSGAFAGKATGFSLSVFTKIASLQAVPVILIAEADSTPPGPPTLSLTKQALRNEDNRGASVVVR
jgi:hypothetical protein